MVLPYFNLKHGQFAAVTLTRSGANKILKKCGKRLSPAERESSTENTQTVFKDRESLTPNFKLPNFQPDSKLTTELTKIWLVLMLKLKAL